MASSSYSTFLPEEDLLYTILADLKRTVGEYTTATTESNCYAVRQLFTDLTNRTLKLQGDLYYYMAQNNMYDTSSPVLQQEIQKQLQASQQTVQQTNQLVQQKLAQGGQHPTQHAHHASHGHVHHHAAYYLPYGAHPQHQAQAYIHNNPYHVQQ